MKGVSEVIAIILILIIVIALAALAYTWFSGIFSSLTGTAGTAVTTTTTQMTYQFAVESVRRNAAAPFITVVIRNTGTPAIAQATISTFVNGRLFTNNAPAGNLGSGSTLSIGINDATLTAALACPNCNNNKCWNDGAFTIPTIVKVGIPSGLEQMKQVAC